MVEWRAPNLQSARRTPLAERQLMSAPVAEMKADRFPRDPLAEYYDFLDSGLRRSVVAFVEYGANPGRSAQLVEQCWVKGIPVIVWFADVPAKDTPFFRQILGGRSIEIPEEGRLRWRPVLSWHCDKMEGFAESFSGWFRREDPLFPPPLVRIAFDDALPLVGAIGVLEDLAKRPPLCRFKLFSFSSRWRKRLDGKKCLDLLDSFCQAPLPSEGAEGKVIDLFPEGRG
jgi:hypothetical protein